MMNSNLQIAAPDLLEAVNDLLDCNLSARPGDKLSRAVWKAIKARSKAYGSDPDVTGFVRLQPAVIEDLDADHSN